MLSSFNSVTFGETFFCYCYFGCVNLSKEFVFINSQNKNIEF